MSLAGRVVAGCFTIVLAAAPSQLEGQQPLWMAAPTASVTAEATIGSAAEHTARILELMGDSNAARPHPVSGLRVQPLWLVGWVNTTRANSDDDGAVWQGRGLTASLTAGVVYNARLLSVSVRPLVFATQNAAFTPARPDTQARAGFGNPFGRMRIDLPYRFGRSADASFSPGESWVRLGTPFVGTGVSTASERWGPSHVSPLIMSTEGPGFPRLFAEMQNTPLHVGQFSGRWIVGRLEASPYSGRMAGDRSRLVTALTSTFAFSGPLRGVSVGGARFFHIRWDDANVRMSNVLLPLKGLLKQGNPTGEARGARNFNQVASAFARLAPPDARFELYGEFYREDNNQDLRDLIVEPDHESAYTLGVRRVWRGTAGTSSALTLETTNSRTSHLGRVRNEGAPYLHYLVTEGHTYEGQPIGSIDAFGGGGASVLFERIGLNSATSVEARVRRTAQNSEGGTVSGVFAARPGVRFGRTWVAGQTMRGWGVDVDRGLGLERGVNLTLTAFLGADLMSRAGSGPR